MDNIDALNVAEVKSLTKHHRLISYRPFERLFDNYEHRGHVQHPVSMTILEKNLKKKNTCIGFCCIAATSSRNTYSK